MAHLAGRVVLTVGLLTRLPGAPAAQDTAGAGAVAGSVVSADGEPAVVVTVCLVRTIRCAVTGPDSRFRLRDVRPARYDLEIIGTGGVPVLYTINGKFRLNVRVERRFGARTRPFIVFAGVQNVTNRQNVAGCTWNRRLNRERVQEQVVVFPIGGFEYHF